MGRFLLTSVLSLTLAGCFPMRFVSRPGVSGVVLDDSTSRPVANTTVTLRMKTSDGEVTSTTSTTTGAQGAFLIPARHVWWIYFVGMDFVGYRGTAELEAPGYTGTSLEVHGSPMGPSIVLLGDIRVPKTH